MRFTVAGVCWVFLVMRHRPPRSLYVVSFGVFILEIVGNTLDNAEEVVPLEASRDDGTASEQDMNYLDICFLCRDDDVVLHPGP